MKGEDSKKDYRSYRQPVQVNVMDDVTKSRLVVAWISSCPDIKLKFRLNFYNVGDTAAFHVKIKEQLVTDLRESQEEYNLQTLAEDEAKADHKRRAYLKEHPKEVNCAKDRLLCSKPETWYKTEWENVKVKRKAAKKEFDEANKALENHKEEESSGFSRENDVEKVGSQYRTTWTCLPRYIFLRYNICYSPTIL